MRSMMQFCIEWVDFKADLKRATNKVKCLIMLLFLVLTCFLPRTIFAEEKLLHITDLTYLGAFRVPSGTFGASDLDYGGQTIGFNPVNNSLFISGHDSSGIIYIGEISIVTPKIGTIASLNTATILQNFSDTSEGNYWKIKAGSGTYSGNAIKVGGLMVHNSKLIVTEYAYYDASYEQVLSHYKSGMTLSTSGDFSGIFQVGISPLTPNPGYISGYMGTIPAPWQFALGGAHFTGNACLSILGRTSYGPSVSSFNVTDLGVEIPAVVTPLVYYDSTHTTLGGYGDTVVAWPYFSASDTIQGVFFPAGSRSVLFYGRHGLSPHCYGEATYDNALHGQPVLGEPGVIYCYDPVKISKGPHNYPYIHQIWAYDANDLVSVKNGMKQPWEIVPYEAWNLDNIGNWYSPQNMYIYGGAAYDPVTSKLYISQTSVDTGSKPVIHVFKFPPPPSSPTRLMIPASGS